MNDSHSQPRFSEEIRALLEHISREPLTLAYLLTETSERGFSLVIGLLALPFLFPMPPGVSTILGSACLLLSAQMLLGRRSPWLPRKVAQFKFPQGLAMHILNNLKRVTRFTERFVRPRFGSLTRNPLIWHINGACLGWLTILLMLPIPMTNPVPTIGILTFVVATLEADGLMMCVGYGLTVLITVMFGVIGYLLWRSPELLNNFT